MKLTEEQKTIIANLFLEGRTYTEVFRFCEIRFGTKLHPEQLIRIKKSVSECRPNKYIKDIINATEDIIDIRNGIKSFLQKTTIRTINLKKLEILLDDLEHHLQELHQKIKKI